MKHLATALALAICYLEDRSPTSTEENDVEVLEGIAEELQHASSDERDTIIAALVALGRADLVDGLGLDEPASNS